MRRGLASATIITLAVLVVPTYAAARSTSRAAGRGGGAGAAALTKVDVSQSFGRLPLAFEENKGQTPAAFRFVSRANGYSVFLSPTEAQIALRSPNPAEAPCTELHSRVTPCSVQTDPISLRMQLVGGNGEAGMAGLEPLPGTVNYFVGRDSAQWRTNIPTFRKVRAKGIYPGVDLVYYGDGKQLEYDFVVDPGADPGSIRLTVKGAERVELDDRGDVVLHALGQELRMRRPVIYQEDGALRHEIPGGYTVLAATDRQPQDVEIGFRIGAYDLERPLVIDPVLSYSTYLGGGDFDFALDIAIDASGSAYVVGRTFSTDFPTASAVQPSLSGSGDAFIAKLDPSGSSLVYSTYLGGTAATLIENATAISVDAGGNAYVTGTTDSTDFPVINALQVANAGAQDAFLVKLDPTGTSLIYSTYLGGSGGDAGVGVAVDSVGKVYVSGTTTSADYPVANAFQATYGGGAQDGFLTAVDASGSALVYSTYLGGSDLEVGRAIAVSPSGQATFTGQTFSTDFPTSNPVQPSLGGFTDAFVARFSATGTLVYSTYLGGSAGDVGSDIAIDGSGNAYVTGFTASADFPIVNAFQPGLQGTDAFITKVNPAGTGLVYSTFLGGASSEFGSGIALDLRGNVYILGSTLSADFPTVNPVQPALAGSQDAFVAALDAAGSGLIYSTYLGGSGSDATSIFGGLAVDQCTGDAYVTGATSSNDFPVANPFQAALSGAPDSFVTKLAFPPAEQIQILRNQVAALVTAGVLNAGQANALDSRLQQALTAIAGGNVATAISRLQVFILQVNAFINANILTPTQGQPLIDGANELIAVLSC